MAAAWPNGIDVHFENAGGAAFEAVLPLLNVGARIQLCGIMARWQDTGLPRSPDHPGVLTRTPHAKRIKMQGFFVSDYRHRHREFFVQMSACLEGGKIKFHEDIVDGFENSPRAFMDLLEGKRFGKFVIRVANA